MCWDGENRLVSFSDHCKNTGFYQYDAGGERTYKLTWAGSTSNRSGDRSIYYTPDEATLYASPYLVITPQGYTKHYYAEAERITSQLGKGQFADVGTPVVSDSLVQVKLQEVTDNVEYPSTLTVSGSGVFAYLDTLTNQQNATSTLYFYHPDHLGSSSWITTTNGTVKQHLHYLPWGEDYVNQRLNDFDGVRYTFSAKEKDTETGYSYFGARYYSSDLSIWLSVDPQAAKYPSLSPYVYCADNPVRLVDPNGEAWDIDGYTYTPGDACPKGVPQSTMNKWNTMNEIYKTEIGKAVINALNGDDCLYHVSSDIRSDGMGGFSSKDKTIYLNGNDREVGTLAHEMFHAYQDYNNRSEASIFNEVEANLFSFSVLFQQCEAAINCIFTPKHSPLVNGQPSENSSKEYERYYGDASYLLLGNFNREKFNNVVSGFLEYSKQNANGKYNNGYKQGGDIYENTLIEKFFK